MATVAVLVPDLMLASRVIEPLEASGYQVVAGPLPGVVDGADVIVCDLDSVEPQLVVSTGVPSIGFHSHLDVATGQDAREAGVDLVVARSRMARELPDLVARLLDPKAGTEDT